MARFVLVHGSWHGAWCWEKVTTALEGEGHEALAVDLPAHGADPTPASEATLDAYAERVCQALEARPHPSILVGHSMGGIAISQAAERSPSAAALLVYVCAFLPRNGESLLDLFSQDSASFLHGNLEFSADGLTCTVRDPALREAFYADCGDAAAKEACARLVPDPLVPLGTPVGVTAARFGAVRRAYVECLQDRTVTPALQRAMRERSPCAEVAALDTSHSPFLSAPAALARQLSSWAARANG